MAIDLPQGGLIITESTDGVKLNLPVIRLEVLLNFLNREGLGVRQFFIGSILDLVFVLHLNLI